MSGDCLSKVRAGLPLRIPADAYNAFVDAAVDLRMRRQQGGGAESSGHRRESGLVLVRNDSGGDRERFSVVALGAPLISPADNEAEFNRIPPFSVALPTATTDLVAILQDPVPSGTYGYALLSGVSPALLSVTSEDDNYAKPATNGRLVTGSTGPWRVLYAESGTGNKRGIVASLESEDSIAVVKIVSATSEGGKYNGRILTGLPAMGSGDEAMPQGLTVPASNDCYVLNLDEDGLPTHKLQLPGYAVGRRLPQVSGLPMVFIQRAQPAWYDYYSLGSDGTWYNRRNTNNLDLGAVPVEITVVVGISPTRMFTRVLRFDAEGRLYFISGEQQSYFPPQ